MSRRLVEGKSRDNISGNFPDTAAVVVLPAPPADVVLRDPQNGGEFVFTVPGAIANLDTGGVPSDHTFNFFLRGTDVPGGELNLNPIIGGVLTPVSIAEGESGVTGVGLPLVGDMRVEVEMQEAIDTIAPAFVQSWEDHYAPLDNLEVVPVVPRIQLETFNDGAPFVIAAPDEFSTRMVKLSMPPAFVVGTMIVNLDDVSHTMSITLRDTGGPDQVLATKVVASGEAWSNAAALMVTAASIDLKAGQSLEISTATPTSTVEPYVYASYEDRI
jgi:hypothetical protein